MAAFFNDISQEYSPLEAENIPSTYPRSLPHLEVEQVARLLKLSKKCHSKVEGDINPELYNIYSQELAVPVTNVFNQITIDKKWPSKWKTEYVTIIPKGGIPEGPGDCRNMSCSNF